MPRKDESRPWRALYGKRWARVRLQHLARDPLCVRCAGDGLVVPATVVDHIKPHKGDTVLFWDRTNWQSMCAPCHDGPKQREEHYFASELVGRTHPPLTVMVGPSCAGKSTWSKAYAGQTGALRLELDVARGEGVWTRETHDAACDEVIRRVRAADIGQGVIVDTTALGGPWRKRLRDVARSLGRTCDAVVLDAPLGVLLMRGRERDTPEVAAQRAGVLLRMAEQMITIPAALRVEPWHGIYNGTWKGSIAHRDPIAVRGADGEIVACAIDGYPSIGGW